MPPPPFAVDAVAVLGSRVVGRSIEKGRLAVRGQAASTHDVPAATRLPFVITDEVAADVRPHRPLPTTWVALGIVQRPCVYGSP